MSQTTVTMQLNLGHNPAGDWANRPVSSAAATGHSEASAAPVASGQSELMLRLHVLRGAIDAMRGQAFGPTLAATYSSRATVGYGSPEAYRGLYFVFGSADAADAELS